MTLLLEGRLQVEAITKPMKTVSDVRIATFSQWRRALLQVVLALKGNVHPGKSVNNLKILCQNGKTIPEFCLPDGRSAILMLDRFIIRQLTPSIFPELDDLTRYTCASRQGELQVETPFERLLLHKKFTTSRDFMQVIK